MKKHTTPDKSVIPMWGEVWLSDRQTHAYTDRRRTKWSLCDLWPSKSIGFILSPWLTCLPSLIKKSTTVKSLLCSQAYFHRCPLWPWPLTSKINRVHPLIMVNMSAKFDKEICNGVDSIAFTRSTHRQTDGTTEPIKSDEEADNAGQISDPYVRGSVTIGQTDTRTHRQTQDKVIPMWPLTFKINRVHPLTMVNMFAKSDKKIHNG